MKIVCLSDMHGNLPKTLPDGDALVIAGDICPATNHKVSYQVDWLEDVYNPWLKSLPYGKDNIAMIAGNHDWCFMNVPSSIPDLHCHYLEDSGATVGGLNVYGYPHTPMFCDWAFNRTPEYLANASNKIPDNTDILLTHGPPYGILDVVTEAYWDSFDPNAHLGCKELIKRVYEMPDLKLHVFGHIHSGHGIEKPSVSSDDKTIYVNASIINERYKPVYDIITVDI